MEKVKRNKYVENDSEARPIILETMRFLCDLETMSTASNEMQTPALAIPRLPHEVIFAIGGWSEGAAQSIIESYDTRADRWIRVHPEDPQGPRAYHGTAVLGKKIYCIGGFNGVDYFNTCTRFDAEKKTWKEIAPMHTRRCYVSVAALDGFIYALGEN
jgi:kelch-like protein 10